MNRHPAPRRSSAGFTLVETMVAIVIGLLATLIVMQVYATSEGSKRTITGGADAQSDAAVALYLIERDLRQAGYGLAPNTEDFVPIYTAPVNGSVLSNGILAQCTSVRAYNANRATTQGFVYGDFTFAPVVINPVGYPAGDAGTDVVLINYGTSSGVTGKGLVFSTVSDSGSDNVLSFKVSGTGTPDPRSGFVAGDMYLALPNAGGACTIGEVSGIPGDGSAGCIASLTLPVPPNWWPIQRNAADYASAYKACAANSATAAWNETGDDAVDYTAGGKIYDLGPANAFVSRVYAVRNSNLTVCDLTRQDCILGDPTDAAVWTPIASQVVGFKAQYGKDTDLNGGVNAWDSDPPTLNAVTTTAGAARAQIIAVRLALVVRSGQFEKTAVTTANPTWYGGDFDLTGLTDWDHYRYKTAQSIVPLRDMIWGVQN